MLEWHLSEAQAVADSTMLESQPIKKCHRTSSESLLLLCKQETLSEIEVLGSSLMCSINTFDIFDSIAIV